MAIGSMESAGPFARMTELELGESPGPTRAKISGTSHIAGESQQNKTQGRFTPQPMVRPLRVPALTSVTLRRRVAANVLKEL
jgi:hypothetical protein